MDTGAKITIAIGLWVLMSLPMAILMGKLIKAGSGDIRQHSAEKQSQIYRSSAPRIIKIRRNGSAR